VRLLIAFAEAEAQMGRDHTELPRGCSEARTNCAARFSFRIGKIMDGTGDQRPTGDYRLSVAAVGTRDGVSVGAVGAECIRQRRRWYGEQYGKPTAQPQKKLRRRPELRPYCMGRAARPCGQELGTSLHQRRFLKNDPLGVSRRSGSDSRD